MVTPSRRREVVSYLRSAYDVSERRACRTIGMSRASYRYRSVADPQSELRVRLRDLAALGDGLRRRRALQRAPLRMLTVVDCRTREALAIVPRVSILALGVLEVLDRLERERGAPQTIRCDNGPEFAGRVLDQWAYFNEVELDFSRPGKPTDNAYIESFNARLRQELLERQLVPVDGGRAGADGPSGGSHLGGGRRREQVRRTVRSRWLGNYMPPSCVSGSGPWVQTIDTASAWRIL